MNLLDQLAAPALYVMAAVLAVMAVVLAIALLLGRPVKVAPKDRHLAVPIHVLAILVCVFMGVVPFLRPLRHAGLIWPVIVAELIALAGFFVALFRAERRHAIAPRDSMRPPAAGDQ